MSITSCSGRLVVSVALKSRAARSPAVLVVSGRGRYAEATQQAVSTGCSQLRHSGVFDQALSVLFSFKQNKAVFPAVEEDYSPGLL